MKQFYALILVILCSTVSAMAETYSGTTGDCTWSLDTSSGTLIISGSGNMENYYAYKCPWYNYKSYIKTVTIGDGVTSVGSHAFYNCASITNTTMPQTVISIGTSAFGYCTSLTSITIPNSVTSISEETFYCCTSLTSATISSSVKTLPNTMFYKCSSLTNITIPESVATIADYVFSGCSNLMSITCLATTPPSLDETAFDSDHYSDATLYAASVDYTTATSWCNFKNIIYPESNNTSTGIKDIDAQKSTIEVDNQAIVIDSSADQQVAVYSLGGQVIAKQHVSAGTTKIAMPQSGIYIAVLSDGTKVKVLVK